MAKAHAATSRPLKIPTRDYLGRVPEYVGAAQREKDDEQDADGRQRPLDRSPSWRALVSGRPHREEQKAGKAGALCNVAS
jgi:hypothetical protein